MAVMKTLNMNILYLYTFLNHQRIAAQMALVRVEANALLAEPLTGSPPSDVGLLLRSDHHQLITISR